MPRRGSEKHNGPKGQCKAQCPRRAVQNTVPQKDSAKHCPKKVVKSTVPQKGSK